MLKWAVGQRNPTPGQHVAQPSRYPSAIDQEGSEPLNRYKSTGNRLHVARRRHERGKLRKAEIRSLRRISRDKENRPCLTPESNAPSRTRDNSIESSQMALRDLSNSPDPYAITPRLRNHVKRRQSHPLNSLAKKPNCDHSKSAPTNAEDYLKGRNLPECETLAVFDLNEKRTQARYDVSRTSKVGLSTPAKAPIRSGDSLTDLVDARNQNSTLKSLFTMQIEYSPGPLTATQSLVSLRQRLTKSLSSSTPTVRIDDDRRCSLRSSEKFANNGITISCGDQSPIHEGPMEEKSIFERISDRIDLVNNFSNVENSRWENSLVSSLSEKLEWLRLNNSLSGSNLPKGETNREEGECESDFRSKTSEKRKSDCGLLRRQKCVRRKSRKCCREDGVSTGNGSFCDKNKPKAQERPKLMGLTIPLGIPSPVTSEDSGLCSLGLEGIHPLSISPAEKEDFGNSTETGNESASVSAASLVLDKCSPSSICSSLRKRISEDVFESRDDWSEESVPLVKTPKLSGDPRFKVEDDSSTSFNFDFVFPSPLALVEKRSRSRRCLRFVSPGRSRTCQRHPSGSRRPISLSCPRLKDGREGAGDLELSIRVANDFIAVHVGRGTGLRGLSGTGCNAYVKVALVPSSERTFFRTPVHRQSSCPNFNEKFYFRFRPEDLNKRILVSVWHRDRDNRKSEFLGCVSFAVKNAIKKEISGSFRLVAQSGGSKTPNHQQTIQSGSGSTTSGPRSVMARRTGNAATSEEIITVDEDKAGDSPEKNCKFSGKKKVSDEGTFLRHLELEPIDGEGGRVPLPEAISKGGRTPFTTTKQLTKRPGSGFGFSIAWVKPPRVERVEAGLPADRAGIRPGDFVIFVDRHNVAAMSEEQILQIIKSCGNELTLEIYRKSNQNGVVEPPPAASSLPSTVSAPIDYDRSTKRSTAYSAATSASYDFAKRRLHLPQVAFTNEIDPHRLSPEESRKRAVYQLLSREQNYAINLQFGINRFLVPLTEKKEFLNANQHRVLFQNIEEILALTEETLEQATQEEIDLIENFVGRLYLKRILVLKAAYRRYCAGIKRADCLLAEKSKNPDFNRFCAEPSIPRKKPDLITFLHKPLEHYRELLKLLQTILNIAKSSDVDHVALSRVVIEMQATFREVTAGLMEPEVEGRPLLCVQDLESRLVFTRCKPFVLSIPGRRWIFGGDLTRVEGRAVHPFWALLFTDMMVFAKVSRDRVLFITEEPLSLLAVSQAFFNIRKKANEFRLVLSAGGTESPTTAACGPDMVLSRTPKKNTKLKSVALRAPTPELKAVWQNLIQRQIIYLNTTRGSTPSGSPLDSPEPFATFSAATFDSLSLRRQIGSKESRIVCSKQNPSEMENGDRKECNHRCEHFNCRQSGPTKPENSARMTEWMKNQASFQTGSRREKDFGDLEPVQENGCKMENFEASDIETEARFEEIDWFSERNASRNTGNGRRCQSTSESRTTVKSNGPEKTVSVCRKCHKTCLGAKGKRNLPGGMEKEEKEEDGEDVWRPLMMLGMCGMLPSDPFAPTSDPPSISVLPPTPDRKQKDEEGQTAANSGSSETKNPPPSKTNNEKVAMAKGEPFGKGSSSPIGLRRYSTANGLERIANASNDKEETKEPEQEEEEEEEEEKEEKIEVKTHEPEMGDSIRGWTVRAGSYVAGKMSFFERISSPDNSVTIRKTTFLERYLKPSGENNLESPDVGTNTSSSGRGEDEGETSGGTSGEEIWGTPTSGGDVEEELLGDSSTLSFLESPRGSMDADEETEQLMEDLLINLPMMAVKGHGVPLRRKLEPLLEEEDDDDDDDDPDDFSGPSSPQVLRDTRIEQDRGSFVSPNRHREGSSKVSPSPKRFTRKATTNQQTTDKSLGIRLDNEEEEEEDTVKFPASPSILRKFGLKCEGCHVDHSRKPANRLLAFLSRRKINANEGNRNSASYGARPLFRYLFNKDGDDELSAAIPAGRIPPCRRDEKRLEKRFWNQLRRRKSSEVSITFD